MKEIIMPIEALVLSAYHSDQADYCLACKQSNVKNAKDGYFFGEMKTKKDLMNRATRYDDKRKFHRKRARIFSAII